MSGKQTRAGKIVYADPRSGDVMHKHWCCIHDHLFTCFAAHERVQFSVCTGCAPRLDDGGKLYQPEHTHTCRACGERQDCNMEEGHDCVVAVYFCTGCNRLTIIQEFYAHAHEGQEWMLDNGE